MSTHVLKYSGIITFGRWERLINTTKYEINETQLMIKALFLIFTFSFLNMIYIILVSIINYRLEGTYKKMSRFIIQPNRYSKDIRNIQRNSCKINSCIDQIIIEDKKYKPDQYSSKLINILIKIKGLVNTIDQMDLNLIRQRKEATKMISKVKTFYNTVKAFPIIIKIHLFFIFLSGLFMFLAGLCDFLGHTMLNIKTPGMLFGVLLWVQFLFYFVNPERWSSKE